jgi:hypothetical protein
MLQRRSFSGSAMSFTVHATIDGHRVLTPAETPKDAFAKAIEWHVAHQFADVVINDGSKDYSIAEFSGVMALSEIEAAQRNT